MRIARDVLCAGTSGVKVCLPDDPEETARALARRGSRRPVLVGNDRALLRVVQLLHREGALHEAALSVVPVGDGTSVALAGSLGIPLDAVTAARAVLTGAEHRLDLLVDDGGAVVLGGVRVPAGPEPAPEPRVPRQGTGPGEAGGSPLRRACRSLVRTVLPQSLHTVLPRSPDGKREAGRGAERRDDRPPVARDPGREAAREAAFGGADEGVGDGGGDGVGDRGGEGQGGGERAGASGVRRRPFERGAGAEPYANSPQKPPSVPAQWLRVEADGKLLADFDEPVGEVSLRTTHDGGLAEVTVRPLSDPSPVRAMAREVTVSGGDGFRYRTDTARVGGPVTSRTWTVLPHAWRLVLPRADTA
ncbi:hypothetical protein [Streptomyces iconiensis]|uniref:DAGKc domain-containing protein n=1 Tax=Streptomyces iconiensis TaxID=1384038 RepID=A0ABT7AAP1_9ACTN|nr:hypothetical protein [Streptomyces iconiensis]MDJ1138370.1 hypothetical protein [Streptomyces iconiensis]